MNANLKSERSGRPTRRKLAELPEWLRSLSERGDLLLVGSDDYVSRAIQRSLGSPYSHALLVVGPGRLAEAYDYSLTLYEGDEGVYELSFDEFFARSQQLADVLLLRNRSSQFDPDKFAWLARELAQNSPAYPTTAAVTFIAGQLLGRVANSGRHRLLRPSAKTIARQTLIWGDGPRRMHCAELAARLYVAAAGTVELHRPILGPYIDSLGDPGDYSLDELPPIFPRPRRRAGKGLWYPKTVKSRPRRLLVATVVGISDLSNAAVNRVLRNTQPDPADFVMPPDFVDAGGFTQVDRFVVAPDGNRMEGRRWRLRRPKNGFESDNKAVAS